MTLRELNFITFLLFLFQEFYDKIATKCKIMKFISRVINSDCLNNFDCCHFYAVLLTSVCNLCPQKVQKAYAFEIQDVPVTSEYLEVKYSVRDDKF